MIYREFGGNGIELNGTRRMMTIKGGIIARLRILSI